MATLLLFIILGICLVFTVPIAIALILSTAVSFVVYHPGTPLFNLLSQAMITTIDSFPLMAIPFFMLVGILMGKSGIAVRLIKVGEAVAGNTAGGLGAATILACILFAAISGSGPAVVAAIGAIMIPAMADRKYGKDYSASLVASAATIGPVIPPSIPMIIFGATVGVSVTELFTAGFVPGVVMGVGLLAVNYFVSKKRGYLGKEREGGFLWVVGQIWEGKWALLMPIIILGGIYGGVFTPTEAAVVGAFYALAVGAFIYRDLTLQAVRESFVEAGLLSAIVMILLGGATTFGRLLTIEQAPARIAEFMLGITDTPILIMLMINAALLVAGMFIDPISNIILFAPLLVPIVVMAGYNPVYFGVIMTVNLCIGFITPPLGVNLFVAQGVARVPFESIVRQVLPFLFILIVTLLLMIFVPRIVTILPELMGFM